MDPIKSSVPTPTEATAAPAPISDAKKSKPGNRLAAKKTLIIAGALMLLAFWFWPRSMGRNGENYATCLGYHHHAKELRYAPTPPSNGDRSTYDRMFGGGDYVPYGAIGEPLPDYCFGMPFGRRF